MSILTVNGLSLHLELLAAEGKASTEPRETVVFLHGMLTDSLASYYFTMAPAFAAAGIDVIMYDHRGHGRSTRIETGYELENLVDDLDVLLRTVHTGGAVHLVGNSYGGTLAFAFALRFPEKVATVSVVESEPPTEAWAAKMSVNLEKAKSDLVKPGASAWIALNYGRHTMRLAKAASRMLHDTRIAVEVPGSATVADDAIASMSAPVLAIYGSRSELAAQAPVLERMVPECRTVIVPDQEHSVLVEEPALVQTLVLDWVRAHPVMAVVG